MKPSTAARPVEPPSGSPFQGETVSAAMCRERDWNATPLGPPEDWPAALRSAATIVTAASRPMALLWGPDRLQVHNAAFRRIVGCTSDELGLPAGPGWPGLKLDGPELTPSPDSGAGTDDGSAGPEVTVLPIAGEGADGGSLIVVDGPPVETASAVALQEALEESERNFRTLANQIPQLVWMADQSGSIVWYNERWYEYTGATPGEVRGWGWTKVHHPDHVDRVVERIRRCFENGHPWEDTFPLRHRGGGYRWFLSRALPIRDEEGRVVRWFGTNTDITHQRETEAELRRLKNRAEAASRAKSRFLAVMSHELRTPLTGIIGYADLLDAGLAGDLSERAMEYVSRIHQGARHLTGLIDEILSLSRIEAGTEAVEWEDVDLVELVGGVASLLALRAADKGLDFRSEFPDGPLPVRTDPGKVRQILLNLLGNAIKFTEDGTVSLVMEPVEDGVEIRVRDTGKGIAPGDREQVFEAFHQVDQSNTRSAGGSGLGLSVSRKLARLVGGDVVLEETLGPGSTFALRLPGNEGMTSSTHL